MVGLYVVIAFIVLAVLPAVPGLYRSWRMGHLPEAPTHDADSCRESRMAADRMIAGERTIQSIHINFPQTF